MVTAWNDLGVKMLSFVHSRKTVFGPLSRGSINCRNSIYANLQHPAKVINTHPIPFGLV